MVSYFPVPSAEKDTVLHCEVRHTDPEITAIEFLARGLVAGTGSCKPALVCPGRAMLGHSVAVRQPLGNNRMRPSHFAIVCCPVTVSVMVFSVWITPRPS